MLSLLDSRSAKIVSKKFNGVAIVFCPDSSKDAKSNVPIKSSSIELPLGFHVTMLWRANSSDLEGVNNDKNDLNASEERNDDSRYQATDEDVLCSEPLEVACCKNVASEFNTTDFDCT